MATRFKTSQVERRTIKKKTSIGGNKGRISPSMLGKVKRRDYKPYNRQGK
tara:strand:- start:316 stop:465 length:150 start_codon:yes stop_codon:yes gene_type:complete